jgi:hypothetical protein
MMTPSEHSPLGTRAITGLFGMLGGFSTSRGSGAPAVNATNASKIRLLVSLAATAAFFAFTGTALALAPAEPPETGKVEAITATTATLHGVLAPKASESGEGGSYFFLFGVDEPPACGEEHADYEEGGVLHEGYGTIVGASKETVEATLTDLHPRTKYTVCLFQRGTNFESLSEREKEVA